MRHRVIFMIILALLLLFDADIAWGKRINCSLHKIYCAIVELRPNIDKDFAMQLSNVIHVESKKYRVDPYRVVAIMYQESGIVTHALNKKYDKRVIKECDDNLDCVTTIVETSTVTDYGLFQFHRRTMEIHDLDVHTVMNNWRFTVRFAIQMIADKIRMCKRLWPTTAWACYNSATPGKHEEYVEDVNRWYLRK